MNLTHLGIYEKPISTIVYIFLLLNIKFFKNYFLGFKIYNVSAKSKNILDNYNFYYDISEINLQLIFM